MDQRFVQQTSSQQQQQQQQSRQEEQPKRQPQTQSAAAVSASSSASSSSSSLPTGRRAIPEHLSFLLERNSILNPLSSIQQQQQQVTTVHQLLQSVTQPEHRFPSNSAYLLGRENQLLVNQNYSDNLLRGEGGTISDSVLMHISRQIRLRQEQQLEQQQLVGRMHFGQLQQTLRRNPPTIHSPSQHQPTESSMSKVDSVQHTTNNITNQQHGQKILASQSLSRPQITSTRTNNNIQNNGHPYASAYNDTNNSVLNMNNNLQQNKNDATSTHEHTLQHNHEEALQGLLGLKLSPYSPKAEAASLQAEPPPPQQKQSASDRMTMTMNMTMMPEQNPSEPKQTADTITSKNKRKTSIAKKSSRIVKKNNHPAKAKNKCKDITITSDKSLFGNRMLNNVKNKDDTARSTTITTVQPPITSRKPTNKKIAQNVAVSNGSLSTNAKKAQSRRGKKKSNNDNDNVHDVALNANGSMQPPEQDNQKCENGPRPVMNCNSVNVESNCMSTEVLAGAGCSNNENVSSDITPSKSSPITENIQSQNDVAPIKQVDDSLIVGETREAKSLEEFIQLQSQVAIPDYDITTTEANIETNAADTSNTIKDNKKPEAKKKRQTKSKSGSGATKPEEPNKTTTRTKRKYTRKLKPADNDDGSPRKKPKRQSQAQSQGASITTTTKEEATSSEGKSEPTVNVPKRRRGRPKAQPPNDLAASSTPITEEPSKTQERPEATDNTNATSPKTKSGPKKRGPKPRGRSKSKSQNETTATEEESSPQEQSDAPTSDANIKPLKAGMKKKGSKPRGRPKSKPRNDTTTTTTEVTEELDASGDAETEQIKRGSKKKVTKPRGRPKAHREYDSTATTEEVAPQEQSDSERLEVSDELPTTTTTTPEEEEDGDGIDITHPAPNWRPSYTGQPPYSAQVWNNIPPADTNKFYVEEDSWKFHNPPIGGAVVPRNLPPLPKAKPIPEFPKTGYCTWTFHEESRVLLADFRRSNKDEKVLVTFEDEKFLLEMFERDDVTVISDGLVSSLDIQNKWSLSYIEERIGDVYYHKFRRFDRNNDVVVNCNTTQTATAPENNENMKRPKKRGKSLDANNIENAVNDKESKNNPDPDSVENCQEKSKTDDSETKTQNEGDDDDDRRNDNDETLDDTGSDQEVVKADITVTDTNKDKDEVIENIVSDQETEQTNIDADSAMNECDVDDAEEGTSLQKMYVDVKHTEIDIMLSMKIRDYIRYLMRRKEMLNESDPRKRLFSFVDYKGNKVEVDVVQSCLYMIDFDMVKLLPIMYQDFVRKFSLPSILPGESHCMMNAVNRNGRPFMGPNLYLTPPGSFTHLHQDGHGTVDSGHVCVAGYNEVVMLRRVPERHKHHALSLLCRGSKFEALYNLPHGDFLGNKPRWPSKDVIVKCQEMGYYPSVFILKPGQHVHINKGRIHAFRKLTNTTLPEDDCHAELREAILKDVKPTSEMVCVSVAWDWMFRGVSKEGISREVTAMLECAELNRRHLKLSLAIPELCLLQMARSFSASSSVQHKTDDDGDDEDDIFDDSMISTNEMDGIQNQLDVKPKRFIPSELDVIHGILPSLKYVIEKHIKVMNLALPQRESKKEQPFDLVTLNPKPESWNNIKEGALDPYGDSDFFCKFCNKELSNVYFHCEGCDRLLNKEFNICHQCHEERLYRNKIQMHPTNPKRMSTLNHVGNIAHSRKPPCPCKNGPKCKTCTFCSGCSCRCHTWFSVRCRYFTKEYELSLLHRLEKHIKNDNDDDNNNLECVKYEEIKQRLNLAATGGICGVAKRVKEKKM